MFRGFRCGGLVKGEARPDDIQKILGCHTVKVPDHTVIGQDAKLLCREEHGQEPVVGFVTAVGRVGGPTPLGHAAGTGGPVVPVSNVDAGHGLETCHQIVPAFNAPDGVDHTIFGLEIEKGCTGFDTGDGGIHRGIITIGQKYRPQVGVQIVDDAGAVFNLVGSHMLVPPNQVVFVVVHMAAGYESTLGMPLHDLTIDIQAGHGILDQDPLLAKAGQIGGRAAVDHVRMGVGIGR